MSDADPLFLFVLEEANEKDVNAPGVKYTQMMSEPSKYPAIYSLAPLRSRIIRNQKSTTEKKERDSEDQSEEDSEDESNSDSNCGKNPA